MPSCKTQVSPSPVTILAVSNLISTKFYTIILGKCQEIPGISPMYTWYQHPIFIISFFSRFMIFFSSLEI